MNNFRFFTGLIVFVLSLAFALMYVFGLSPFVYGDTFHLLGRLHPFILQVSIGAVFLSAILSFRVESEKNYSRFSFIAFILLSMTLVSGTLMELAENYPNPRINSHFYSGLALYLVFTCSVFSNSGRRIFRLVTVLLIVLTAAIGGYIRHGGGFFWAEGNVLEEISKYHLIFVHLPLGTGLFVYLFRRSLSQKWKTSLILSVILPVVITGALYYLRFENDFFPLNLHAVTSIFCVLIGMSIFLLRYKHAELAFLSLMVFPILSGVLLEYGTAYFSQPLMFSKSEYQEIGVTELRQMASFEENVKPILDKRCISCHNQSLSLGKLNLESLLSIQGSGKIRSFYTARNPGSSGAMIHITDRILSPKHMPFLKGDLSENEISNFKKWINAGGFNVPRTSRTEEFKSSAKSLWAFTDFYKPVIESVDSFLQPINAKNDSTLLLRKLKLTLTGSLPSAMESESFLKRPETYEAIVDSYLDSQDFGINISSYWLDLVSFAGERGSSRIPDAHLFRNYVIESFNKDIPFHGFLAGQLNDDGKRLDLVARQNMLKFLPYDDDEPFYNGEIALSTLFNSTLGIEFKCARCHDHILEPISNERYYSHLTTMKSLMNFRKSIPEHELRARRGSPLEQTFLDVYESTRNDLSFWKARRKNKGPSTELNMEDFANWLTDTKEGVGKFTARVYVNHVWRFVFGKALIEGEGVFSGQTKEPKNLQLLNWLTFEFLENKASTKYLIKKLVMTESFRRKFDACIDCLETGWSKAKRMEAEKVRDNLLRLAGILNLKVIQGQINGPLSEIGTDKNDLRNLRSVFFLRKRNSEDFISKYLNIPKGTKVNVIRESEPGFNQVYFFLGGNYLTEITTRISERYDANQTTDLLIDRIFLDVLSRSPGKAEREMWSEYFRGKNPKIAVLTFLRVLINSDEFLYLM